MSGCAARAGAGAVIDTVTAAASDTPICVSVLRRDRSAGAGAVIAAACGTSGQLIVLRMDGSVCMSLQLQLQCTARPRGTRRRWEATLGGS